jgi:hypothetical protein
MSSYLSGFGGLVVSMLASGTQDRGFKADRSRRIFSGVKNPKLWVPCRRFAARYDYVEVESIRPFLARSFPSSLIEGSILPERFGALPREGRTLGAVRVPLYMTEEKQTQAAHKGSNAINA